MNPHYHPYADLSSPHPPSPDNNNYSTAMGIGGGLHHNGHGAIMQQQGFHQLNNNSPLMNKCAGCGTKITDRFLLKALDKIWHHACLKCASCHTLLADVGTSFFFRQNMILCKEDYRRLYSPTCSTCQSQITAQELVMKTTSQSGNQHPANPGSIQHHVFHLKCFQCSKCHAQLRQGDRYYMLSGNLVCENDMAKIMKSSTAANSNTPPVRKGKVGRPRRSRD